MKTYQLPWLAVLAIGVLLMIFEELTQVLAVVIVVISILALLGKKKEVEVSVDPNKK